MDDKTKFLEDLEALNETAAYNGGKVTDKDISDCFDDMELSDEQLAMIRNYVVSKGYKYIGNEKVKVSVAPGSEMEIDMEPSFLKAKKPAKSETPKAFDEKEDLDENLKQAEEEFVLDVESELSADVAANGAAEENNKLIEMLKEDMKDAYVPTQTEAVGLKFRLAAGEKTVINALTTSYMEVVIKTAEKYSSKGGYISDLIGEGSLALIEALNEITENAENIIGKVNAEEVIEKVDRYVSERIEKAMEDSIDINDDEHEKTDAVVSKYGLIRSAAATLEAQRHKLPTIEEISEYTNIPIAEIRDIINLSEDYGVKDKWYGGDNYG